jgi:hypothetical protein
MRSGRSPPRRLRGKPSRRPLLRSSSRLGRLLCPRSPPGFGSVLQAGRIGLGSPAEWKPGGSARDPLPRQLACKEMASSGAFYSNEIPSHLPSGRCSNHAGTCAGPPRGFARLKRFLGGPGPSCPPQKFAGVMRILGDPGGRFPGHVPSRPDREFNGKVPYPARRSTQHYAHQPPGLAGSCRITFSSSQTPPLPNQALACAL